MAQKCVHKGCGKVFADADEACVYHPGPPVFHEGQKGWQCCKPRVLTFDEFLEIPPCTTGKHSTVDDTPAPKPKTTTDTSDVPAPAPVPIIAPIPIHPKTDSAPTPKPIASQPPSPAPEPESEDDDASLPIPPKTTCRRRSCNADSSAMGADKAGTAREGESCVFHPGHPIFHEGSKGWSCCKRRVLEFDEFLKIEGCNTKDRHMFVGSGKKGGPGGKEKVLSTVRHDFYQTSTAVHASLYLKKINKAEANIEFSSPTTLDLDLPTADNTRYTATVPLFGSIDPAKSTFKILGTKLELVLAKIDGQGWPVLRADEPRTGEIIQTGRAGKLP